MHPRKFIFPVGRCIVFTGIFVALIWLRNQLIHVDQLDSPRAVPTVTSTHLVLDDGHLVLLPWIQQIPEDNTLFLEVIKDGIEIGDMGEVTCLVGVSPVALTIPFWQKRRLVLSVLTAVLFSAGIDQTQANPGFVSFTSEFIVGEVRIQAEQNRETNGFQWSRMNDFALNVFRPGLNAAQLTHPKQVRSKQVQQKKHLLRGYH